MVFGSLSLVAIMGFVMSDGMENPKTKGQTYTMVPVTVRVIIESFMDASFLSIEQMSKA